MNAVPQNCSRKSSLFYRLTPVIESLQNAEYYSCRPSPVRECCFGPYWHPRDLRIGGSTQVWFHSGTHSCKNYLIIGARRALVSSSNSTTLNLLGLPFIYASLSASFCLSFTCIFIDYVDEQGPVFPKE